MPVCMVLQVGDEASPLSAANANFQASHEAAYVLTEANV